MASNVVVVKAPLHVTITGSTGNIAYSLLFRLAAGGVLGPDQPVVLRLHDLDEMLPRLDGVLMELDDCSFPLLADVVTTSDYKVAFDGASLVVLLGSVPRKQGMERRDLLTVNGEIFKPVGQTLNEVAADDVRILVVGNPCNTNCLIARTNAPDIDDDRWFAMTRLDQNRARAQLAKRAGVPVTDVTNVAIWGNHSNTQYPDAANARVGGRPAPEVIGDDAWLQGEFISGVQERGAAIIAARGASSAASAANAAIDSIVSFRTKTPKGDCASLGVISRGEYDIPEGLQFGFPVISDGSGWKIAEGFELDEFARSKIAITTEELVSERDAVRQLLG